MRISCPQCEEVYSVKESMIPMEGVKTRCKNCNSVFQINPREVVALDSLLGEEGQQSAVATLVESTPEVKPAPKPEPELPTQPKAEPVATEQPIEEATDADDSESSILDRLKHQFAALEVEQAALILAPLLILILCFTIIQMENPVERVTPVAQIEGVEALEVVSDSEALSPELMDIADQEAMPADEEEAVVSELPAITTTDEGIVEESGEVEPQMSEEAESTTVAVTTEEEVVEAAVMTMNESAPAVLQEAVATEAAASTTDSSELYSVQRFSTLMGQLNGDGIAEVNEATITDDVTQAMPVVVEAAEPAVVMVEKAPPPPQETTSSENVTEATSASLYSVQRFTQLMDQLNGGELVEAPVTAAAAPKPEVTEVAAQLSQTEVTAEAVIEAPTATATSDSLYSAKRFTTLMEQLEGGVLPEVDQLEVKTVVASEPTLQSTPQSPAQTEVKEAVKEEDVVAPAHALEAAGTENSDSEMLYSAERFKKLMDQLQKGEIN